MQRNTPVTVLCCAFMIAIHSMHGLATAQPARVLTYEEAIAIALEKSYRVKSYEKELVSMEQSFFYYRAQFKPYIDFSFDVPHWSEMVTQIQRPDGLPVFNSTGEIRYAGNLGFTYVLPTGGDLRLSSEVYHSKISTIIELQNYQKYSVPKAYTRFSLMFSQPIFTANTKRENLELARLQYEKSSNQFTREQMNIIYDVTRSFYQLYRATRQVEIDAARLENSEEAHRIAQLKYQAGRISEGEVLQLEVDAARSRADLTASQSNLEREKNSFRQLIGLSFDEEIEIETEVSYAPLAIDQHKAIEEGLKNRLEVQERLQDIEMQKIQVDRARREKELRGDIRAYYDITGVSSITSGTTGELFESSFDDFANRPPNRGVTFTLSYPLFDWGRVSARTQQQEALLQRAELSYQDELVTIEREIRDIVRSVREAEVRLDLNRKNQETAERSYSIQRMRFENGDITAQDLSQEQVRLTSVQLEYLASYIQYQLSVADLKRKTMWDFENNRSYLKEDYFSQN